jgi:hypothetical protein
MENTATYIHAVLIRRITLKAYGKGLPLRLKVKV